MNELSNFDIDEIVKKSKIKNFHGCYSKDVLPSKMENGFYVINLADDKDVGSHWSALYKFNNDISFYYDSFGFPPPTDIEDKLKGNMIINNKEIQDMSDSSCGYYCISFMKYMDNNKHKNPIDTFNKFLSLYDKNTYKNEIILNDLLYHYTL